MKFPTVRMSFFTKRSTYASTRLRLLGRSMQVFGVVSFALAISFTYFMRLLPMSVSQEVLDAIRRHAIIFGGLKMLSYMFIGRALLRREKWGAYAAVAAIGLPAIIELIWPPRHDPLQTVTQFAAFATLGLILSVKNELGSVLDSELAEHGKPPEPVEPLTPRNRGFGEPRNGSPSVAREPARAVEIMSAHTPVSAAIADPVTIARQVPPA